MPINATFAWSPQVLKNIRNSCARSYYSKLPYKKFVLPHGIMVQDVTNRHSKLCETCKQRPQNKRVLVMHYRKAFQLTTKVYCQDCIEDFFKVCDQNYLALIAELRNDLLKPRMVEAFKRLKKALKEK